MLTSDERAKQMRILRETIAEIKRRLPKHSPSMAIMLELEEAEYALRRLVAEEESEQAKQARRESA